MDNLPACPFCRSDLVFVFRNLLGHRVSCDRCGGTTLVYPTEEMAVEVWIKHAGPLAKMNMGVPQ